MPGSWLSWARDSVDLSQQLQQHISLETGAPICVTSKKVECGNGAAVVLLRLAGIICTMHGVSKPMPNSIDDVRKIDSTGE